MVARHLPAAVIPEVRFTWKTPSEADVCAAMSRNGRAAVEVILDDPPD
jgi:hypothetical protein